MMKQNILPTSPKSKRKKELIKTDESPQNLGSSPEGVDIYGGGSAPVKNFAHKPQSSKRSHSSKSVRSGTTSVDRQKKEKITSL